MQWVPGVISLGWGVKWPGREDDNPSPSSAEVKNEWDYTSTPPYVSMMWYLVKQRDKHFFRFLYLLPHGRGASCGSGDVALQPLSSMDKRAFVFCNNLYIKGMLAERNELLFCACCFTLACPFVQHTSRLELWGPQLRTAT